jgi:DNA ligase (NAD+)
MGSLSKATNKAEFENWAKDKGTRLFLTEKGDGSTVVASYKNGKLVAITTRGDGTEGEDITPNAVQLRNVVRDLASGFTGEIRGEAIMRLSVFKSVFEPLGYKNARNGATGKLRDQKDSGLLKHLEVMWFDVIPQGKSGLKTEADKFSFLMNNGLSTVGFASLEPLTSAQVWEQFAVYDDGKRGQLDYEIDGLVVKVFDLALQEELGLVGGRPKGGVAIKFPSMRKGTPLEDVIWQCGSTGRHTPVAVLEPVNLAGVTIVNASLHNVDQIAKLGIAIGDIVLVQRNNDVIPQVVGLVEKGAKRRKIEPPEKCVVCNEKLTNDGAYLVCANANCGGKTHGKLMTWVEETKIMQIGPANVGSLIEHGITTPVDLYKATKADLEAAFGSAKLGERALNNIAATKTLPLDVVLSALSIPTLGTTNGKRIAEHFGTLKAVLSATKDDIGKVPGIKTNAVKIHGGLQENRKLIEELASILTITEPTKAPAGGKLEGKSFCITGTLSRERDEVHEWIRKNGGTVKSGVSKGLSYLVTNTPNSDSSKNAKADSLGIPKITEAQLYELVEPRASSHG